MLKKKRKLLEMSEDELKAVMNVILPGRFSRKYSKGGLQEEAIHWLLANGLRLSHEFTLIEMDDGSYGVLTDKNRCSCCQQSVLPSVNRRVHGAMKQNVDTNTDKVNETSFVEQRGRFKSDDSPDFLNCDSKSVVIRTQPLPINSSLNKSTTKEGTKIKPEDKKQQEKSGIWLCCVEFGNCFVSLLSNC